MGAGDDSRRQAPAGVLLDAAQWQGLLEKVTDILRKLSGAWLMIMPAQSRDAMNKCHGLNARILARPVEQGTVWRCTPASLWTAFEHLGSFPSRHPISAELYMLCWCNWVTGSVSALPEAWAQLQGGRAGGTMPKLRSLSRGGLLPGSFLSGKS